MTSDRDVSALVLAALICVPVAGIGLSVFTGDGSWIAGSFILVLAFLMAG